MTTLTHKSPQPKSSWVPVPVGEDAQNVESGDFILCHREGLASKIIRVGTRSYFSHAAYCFNKDVLIEALTRGVVQTPLTDYRDIFYVHVKTNLGTIDSMQANTFAWSCLDQKYGWSVIGGLALRYLTPGRGLWFGMNGTEICSGLVAQTQVRGWANYPYNPASMSPEDLRKYYDVRYYPKRKR